MNQTLEEMARAVFQDWFVDFGPVRAKLESREPYLPPGALGPVPRPVGGLGVGGDTGGVGDKKDRRYFRTGRDGTIWFFDQGLHFRG